MRRSLLCAFFAAAALKVMAGDVSLEVSASRQSVYLGESFNLTISVNGADRDATEPDLSAFRNAETRLLGTHSNSRSSISIINGHMTKESFEGRVYSYEIRPKQTGAFKAGPVRVKVDGKFYTHDGVIIQVAGIEKQDRVIAAVKASSTSVLVEEPFTITLSVAVLDLPERYAEDNEPILPQQMPQLSAAFLEIQQATPGLKGPDLNQILNGLIDQSGRQPSFAINNYKSRELGFGGFDSFFGNDDPFKPRPIRFRLSPNRITINGKKYREYTLTLPYTPSKEGEFTFGPLTFKGPVIADVQNNQAQMQNVYTIGPAVTVRVIPPPDEGRPETFIGCVGKQMKASATFDTTVCKVGDPLTLTLEVTGPISISNLRTPLLNLQPELTKDFRIYDDNVSADTLSNGKRFKYRVRPMKEGTLEFPPIKLSYYDSDKHAYETISTLPIPVQAQATAQIATEDISKDVDSMGPLRAESAPKVSGITLSPDGCKDAPLLPPNGRLLTLGLAGPLVCLVAVLFVPMLALFRRIREAGRHSGALAKARHALRRAANAESAAVAFRAYLAERLDVDGSAVTSVEASRLLVQRGVPQADADRCRDSLAHLDEVMYRPDAPASLVNEAVQNLMDLLPSIDRALATKKDPTVPLAILLLCALPLLSFGETEDAFLWEQANVQASTAVKPEEYLKAAETYNRLVKDGIGNGPLFLNLGNALVLAGDGANAVAAYGRAERYLGATPETRQGLSAALAIQAGQPHVDLPWSRTAFFWHYAFPCNVRVTAALCGWTLLWFGILLRILLKRRKSTAARSLSETCLVTGAFIFVLFFASIAVTFMQERHDAATWPERAFRSQQLDENR